MRWSWQVRGHDRRVLALTLLAGLPGVAVSLGFLWLGEHAPETRWAGTIVLVGAWVALAMAVRKAVIHPLRTIASMLAALREGDFSIRARVGDDPDALSLLHLEVNDLARVLREQRLGAVEAAETLRKVLEEIDVAVFAFDSNETLRIVNRAGERLLGRPTDRLVGRSATELRLHETLHGVAPRTLQVAFVGSAGPWEVRRSMVRQEGNPLHLVALSDLSRALREEEREAWKRIIRVLSHEINNSLAPIKSIAGSLRGLLTRWRPPGDVEMDVQKGLDVISARAEALGRFMASYSRLARLPAPEIGPVNVDALVQRAVHLETRLRVEVVGNGDATVQADEDQLEQALINLVRNATDATLEAGGHGVTLRWCVHEGRLQVLVEDEGPGVGGGGNLFVPFYTTKPGGSGIGLVLSRQIAEGHGGSLVLEGRDDRRGARARLVLPMDPRP